MSKELKIFIENEKRRMKKVLKQDEYYLIKIIKEWEKWWFRLNEIYVVRKYPYKATKSGTTEYCYCSDCKKERKGKELYDMYEVIWIENTSNDMNILKIGMDVFGKIGSIIPIEVCEILKIIKN